MVEGQNPAIPMQEGDVDGETHPEGVNPLAGGYVKALVEGQRFPPEQPFTPLGARAGPSYPGSKDHVATRLIPGDQKRCRLRVFSQ